MSYRMFCLLRQLVKMIVQKPSRVMDGADLSFPCSNEKYAESFVASFNKTGNYGHIELVTVDNGLAYVGWHQNRPLCNERESRR